MTLQHNEMWIECDACGKKTATVSNWDQILVILDRDGWVIPSQRTRRHYCKQCWEIYTKICKQIPYEKPAERDEKMIESEHFGRRWVFGPQATIPEPTTYPDPTETTTITPCKMYKPEPTCPTNHE